MKFLDKKVKIPLGLNGVTNHEYDVDFLMGRRTHIIYCVFAKIAKTYKENQSTCIVWRSLMEAEFHQQDLLTDYGAPTWKRTSMMKNNKRNYEEWIYLIK